LEVVQGIDLLADTKLDTLLSGISVVIHTAARVHIMHDASADPQAAYRAMNTVATLRLAAQAASQGVKRFIFLSSIKVNGEETRPGKPFTADDTPNPQDAYSQSKLEAELGLRQIAEQTGMEVVIVRAPLVYGPGVKANFAAMMKWVAKEWPLPLGRIRSNRRSMVGIDNLIDLLLVCTQHPAAANHTFLVSDDEDLSTAALITRLATSMRRSAKLLPVPEWLLLAGAKLLGQDTVIQRLLGSLQVDITKTKMLLDWSPPVDVNEGLRRAVAG
jgi:nucleoside-diphosphate-sugar epimerase